MYTAGLTVREICDLCHQVPATVHLHVRVREKHEPGYQDKHEAALNERGPSRPTTQWRRRLAVLADFYAANGRLPTTTGDHDECSLHRWLWVQRKAFDAGDLPDSKVTLLQKIPGWNERAHRQALDLHWLDTLERFKAFVDEHGAMPRSKTYDSEAEHALGVWPHNQHQMRTKGKLLSWRADKLNQAVPGWRRRT
ncbi:helicase associated domain-containing protein [Glutamicibacter arilaitensis]|uniref:helicase associated domain-containing protein n=1 Tax=Glutamicibacter arilaitensis TaxID=256701 RepID=UPI003FCF1BE4